MAENGRHDSAPFYLPLYPLDRRTLTISAYNKVKHIFANYLIYCESYVRIAYNVSINDIIERGLISTQKANID